MIEILIISLMVIAVCIGIIGFILIIIEETLELKNEIRKNK